MSVKGVPPDGSGLSSEQLQFREQILGHVATLLGKDIAKIREKLPKKDSVWGPAINHLVRRITEVCKDTVRLKEIQSKPAELEKFLNESIKTAPIGRFEKVKGYAGVLLFFGPEKQATVKKIIEIAVQTFTPALAAAPPTQLTTAQPAAKDAPQKAAPKKPALTIEVPPPSPKSIILEPESASPRSRSLTRASSPTPSSASTAPSTPSPTSKTPSTPSPVSAPPTPTLTSAPTAPPSTPSPRGAKEQEIEQKIADVVATYNKMVNDLSESAPFKRLNEEIRSLTAQKEKLIDQYNLEADFVRAKNKGQIPSGSRAKFEKMEKELKKEIARLTNLINLNMELLDGLQEGLKAKEKELSQLSDELTRLKQQKS